LEERGMIADTLSLGTRRWQGIVLIPLREDEGRWEERKFRLERIKKREGVYRRMDIKCVLFSLWYFVLIFF